MKKLKSLIKLYSCILIPLLLSVIINCVNPIKLLISQIEIDKINILMGCVATLIGALIAVLTIYLTFPKNETIKRRMYNSGHNQILLSNIFVGIILYILSLLVWLIFENVVVIIMLFLSALFNTIVASYYIAMLSFYGNK